MNNKRMSCNCSGKEDTAKECPLKQKRKTKMYTDLALTGVGALFSTYMFDAPLSLSLMGWYSIVKILH